MTATLPLNPLDPEFNRDPYPTLKFLRDEDPVHYIPKYDAWLVTRYDDMVAIVTDDRFTVDRRKLSRYIAPAEGEMTPLQWLQEHSTFGVDGPEHTRVRKLLSHAFTPRRIGRLRDVVGEIVENALDDLRGRAGVINIVDEYTRIIPNKVIHRMLGCSPNTAGETFFVTHARLVNAAMNDAVAEPETVNEANVSIPLLIEYVREVIAQRRVDRNPCVLTDMIDARDNDDALSEDELVRTVMGILIAGSETVVQMLSEAIRLLVLHPEQRQILLSDQSLGPAMVVEVLRARTIGKLGTRVALEDVDVRGRTIRKGQLVFTSRPSAQQDERIWKDPGVFDIRRNNERGIPFGRGRHFCVGAALAKLQGSIGIIRFFETFPNPELLEPNPPYFNQLALRGLLRLPMKLYPGVPTARLRYRSRPGAIDARAAVPGRAPLRHSVQSIRCLYETDPDIARAMLPKPLVAAKRPEVFVQFAHVSMHYSEEHTVTIGAATVGVGCTYEGRAGYYVLAMPMEGEFVVIGGRERYGEPKKIAETHFEVNDTRVAARVRRHDIDFLELKGDIGPPSQSKKQFSEYFFCFKAMPSTSGGMQFGGFDGDVHLTMLTWERNYESIHTIDNGEIVLRESKWDPLVDVPVRRIVKMEFARGASATSGRVLRTVPGEWLQPFMVQRYDNPEPGVDIALTSERGGDD